MSDISTTASFAHEGLGLSILVPEHWEAEELAANQVRFHGPEQAQVDHYRPTLSIVVGEPEGYGTGWFDAFCEQAGERLRNSYTNFVLHRSERYTLSSLVPVNATWFDWEPEPGLHMSQLQALVPVGATRLYLINAATRSECAETFLPVFDAIVRSLRVLPPR